MPSAIAAVILAAGRGTRLVSSMPKVLHRVAGRSLIEHVVAGVTPLRCDPVVVVVAPDMAEVTRRVAPCRTAVQDTQSGTGHAVQAAREALGGGGGDVLVLYGDTPLVSRQTLERLLARRQASDRPAVVALAMRPGDPAQYGRLVTGPGDRLDGIVEFADASEVQRAIRLVNGGVMVADGRLLFELLAAVRADNAKGEYYLTDVVAIARSRGLGCAYVEAPAAELLGVNSRAELAAVEAAMQTRLRAQAMAAGATLIDPNSVQFSFDTVLARDVIVEPNVFFGPGVTVGEGAAIRAFSHLEGARIEAGAVIGPFARLRPGTIVGPRARIGNFVEAKNTVLGVGAKANHLSYLGDASVGEGANIGAGTITCNYDGIGKARTEIGARAFIGSNSALVAPVRIGEGAIVGAGSVITKDVAADSIAVARGQQSERPGAARSYRELKKAEHAAKNQSKKD